MNRGRGQRLQDSTRSAGDVGYQHLRCASTPKQVLFQSEHRLKFMRIWVAPWEDTNGDLIVTGYIYTEIEPRRWVIGDRRAG